MRMVAAVMLPPVLAGCSLFHSWFPSSGPVKYQVVEQEEIESPIPVVEISEHVARQVLAAQKRTVFSEAFPDKFATGYLLGPGDMVEVSVWEAPPATLFGATVLDPRAGPATTRVTTFPEQMVATDGTITVPFAGSVPVAGKSPREIETDIAKRLSGKAHQPQLLVRVLRNATSTVTVVGELGQSVRMPLTAKGELLLDALVAAGGVRQPVGKMTIQLSRGGRVLAMPLESIIQDPRQNIVLQPGDVITALHQPWSFTALGATGKNEEIYFETQGITLAQALGRMGGLKDERADARGVFVFRFEDPAAIVSADKPMLLTPEGKAPIVYRVDLKDPRTFLIAQNFPVRNKDVIYIANAPAAELQKFMNLVSSVLVPASIGASYGLLLAR
ncbi:MAG: polysaccharide export protein [Nitrospira sp.]|nr:polysaccharide export protein [Nitrospira sp.]